MAQIKTSFAQYGLEQAKFNIASFINLYESSIRERSAVKHA